jgi:hypothetical protein
MENTMEHNNNDTNTTNGKTKASLRAVKIAVAVVCTWFILIGYGVISNWMNQNNDLSDIDSSQAENVSKITEGSTSESAKRVIPGFVNEGTPKSTKDVEIELAKEFMLKLGELDFNSTPDDVEKLLGTPSSVEKAAGVSIYSYDNKKTEIYFFEDKACYYMQGDIIIVLEMGKVVDSTKKVVKIEPSDFTASPKEIADKFGYPESITIYAEDYFVFEYPIFERSDYEKQTISFMRNASVKTTEFSYSNDWINPWNIKSGDTILSVFKKIYVPAYMV